MPLSVRPVFLLLACIASLPAPAAAQTATPAVDAAPAVPLLTGVFVFDTVASEKLDAVVDRGVKLVKSPLKRMFARGRIREMNTPHAWVLIEPRGDSVRVATDLWDVTVPPSGSVPSLKPDGGEAFQVSGAWEGQAFRQVWTATDGRRQNLFTVSPDGATLTMDVEIHSGQLREPLRYRQVYQRR